MSLLELPVIFYCQFRKDSLSDFANIVGAEADS